MGVPDEGDIQNVYNWGALQEQGWETLCSEISLCQQNLPGALISEHSLLLSPTANSSRSVNYKPCCGTLTQKIIVNIDF